MLVCHELGTGNRRHSAWRLGCWGSNSHEPLLTFPFVSATQLFFSMPQDPSQSGPNRKGKKPGGRHGNQRRPNQGNDVAVRALGKDKHGIDRGWVFVYSREVKERAEDLEEVIAMIEGGEHEIALDELRWLLAECSEFMAAHALLGELAVEMGQDIELARGHFGFAFTLGEKAIDRANCKGPLFGSETTNAPWYDAGRGLAWCFEKQGQGAMADRILALTKLYDASDPAGIGAMLDDLRSGGRPIVTLG